MIYYYCGKETVCFNIIAVCVCVCVLCVGFVIGFSILRFIPAQLREAGIGQKEILTVSCARCLEPHREAASCLEQGEAATPIQ